MNIRYIKIIHFRCIHYLSLMRCLTPPRIAGPVSHCEASGFTSARDQDQVQDIGSVALHVGLASSLVSSCFIIIFHPSLD